LRGRGRPSQSGKHRTVPVTFIDFTGQKPKFLLHEYIIKQSISQRIAASRRIKGKNPDAGKKTSPVAGFISPFYCASGSEEETEHECSRPGQDPCSGQSPMGKSAGGEEKVTKSDNQRLLQCWPESWVDSGCFFEARMLRVRVSSLLNEAVVSSVEGERHGDG
jgi:hypothetical protein